MAVKARQDLATLPLCLIRITHKRLLCDTLRLPTSHAPRLCRERVPFRLTRVLVNAFEVGGIDGVYRTTCVDVMHMLRANRDSLMTVLELFLCVHHLLVSRLR